MAKGIIRTILDDHLEVAKYKEAIGILLVLLETNYEINPFIPEPHDPMLNFIYNDIISLKKSNKEMSEKLSNKCQQTVP